MGTAAEELLAADNFGAGRVGGLVGRQRGGGAGGWGWLPWWGMGQAGWEGWGGWGCGGQGGHGGGMNVHTTRKGSCMVE